MQWKDAPQTKTFVEFWGHERRRALNRRPAINGHSDARGNAWFPVYVIEQKEIPNRYTDNLEIPEGACAFIFYERVVGESECEHDNCPGGHILRSQPTHISDVYLINPEYHTKSSLRSKIDDDAQKALQQMLHDWSTDSCALVEGIYVPLYQLVNHHSYQYE